MNKPLVIINDAAAKARKAWPIVKQRLNAAGVVFDAYKTASRGDATIKTAAALESGVTSIALVGGDGTLGEAAEGFFEFKQNPSELPAPINPNATLAVFPAGTGDDFARSLTNGTRAPLDYWIEVFIHHCRDSTHNVREVDLLFGRCDSFTTQFICLNASTMGIGGETAARVAAQGSLMRRLSGEARFAAAAMVSLMGWRERVVRVSVDDDQVIEAEMNLAAVANTRYAGGGMMLSPQAKNDDGKLDVVIASGLSRAQIVRELSRIHKGGHVNNPKVTIVQGTEARIETFSAEDAMPIEVDGNVRGVTPVEFRVMPKALRFVVENKNLSADYADYTDSKRVKNRPQLEDTP